MLCRRALAEKLCTTEWNTSQEPRTQSATHLHAAVTNGLVPHRQVPNNASTFFYHGLRAASELVQVLVRN